MKKSAKDELKNRSLSDLKVAIETMQRELFSARLHAATKPMQDSSYYKKMRKNIARALTFVRQKQHEERA